MRLKISRQDAKAARKYKINQSELKRRREKQE